jgi:hypothetical protein
MQHHLCRHSPLFAVSSTPRVSPSRSILFVPPRSSALRVRELSRCRPSRTTAPWAPEHLRHGRFLHLPVLSQPPCHQAETAKRAKGAAPLPPRASATPAHTGPPPATSAPPRAPPGRQTPSRPNTRPPATVGHPLHADPLRPTAHRRRATTTVSLLSPFTPNQGHHQPGSLAGHFPAGVGGGGDSPPLFPRLHRNPTGVGPLSRASRSPAVGWAQVHFLNYLLI